MRRNRLGYFYDFSTDVMCDGDAYAFVAEWFDPQAEIARSFLLTYYIADGSLEMIDKKSLKPFLKRIKFPGIKVTDLFIGSCLSIYSRQINLVECANEYTRKLLSERGTNTFFLIKPRGYNAIGKIISTLEACHLALVRMKMIHIKPEDVPVLANSISIECTQKLIQELTTDFSVAIEASVSSQLAVGDALQQLGTTQDHVINAQASPFCFDATRFGTTAAFDSCSSLCLIRPRILKQGKCGQIIDAILAGGFEISAMKLLIVDVSAIDEFFAIYKPVTRQYHEMVKYMTSGPLVAIEIRGQDIVERFQSFCGPFDIQVARELAPSSLRARFGHTTMQNAVHCTDCVEDGPLESQYFFRVHT